MGAHFDPWWTSRPSEAIEQPVSSKKGAQLNVPEGWLEIFQEGHYF